MNIPRLHPDTIEAVKQQAEIVEIISEYVVLRKRGKNYIGLCPFHEEKTASFTVNETKQFYYCFGCGVGGNSLKFLMELTNRSFSEVVLDLAQRYQIPIKTLEPQQRQALEAELSLKEQILEILAVANSFYQHALTQPQGEKALDYLKSVRKLSPETIQGFQLGYAPEGWETLYHYLVEIKRYPLGLLVTAGLIKQRQSGQGYYDLFRDRLMIPIHDRFGKVIAFGSRTLTQEEPKYLNSPENPLFHKGRTLFALDKAYRHISEQEQAIVVEGYFDAIALHSHGIKNVVACLGTALSNYQLKQILRYTQSKEVILNFDADQAGSQATLRAIAEIAPLIYAGQVQLRVLHLPEGKDADEFLKTTPEAASYYRDYLASAPLILDWQIEQLLQDQDLQKAEQLQQVATKMLKLLSEITNHELQAHYLSHCCQLLSQGNSSLLKIYLAKFQRQLQKPLTQKQSNLALVAETTSLEVAEATLLKTYLHYLEYRQLIISSLERSDLLFSFPPHRELWLQVQELEQSGIEPEHLLLYLQDYYLCHPEVKQKINHLLTLSEKQQWEDPQRLPREIQTAIAVLEKIATEKYYRQCVKQWQNLDPLTHSEQMQKYYRELQVTQLKLQQLAKLRQNSDN